MFLFDFVCGKVVAIRRWVTMTYKVKSVSIMVLISIALSSLVRLAAIALLYLDQEDAFWCLIAIVEVFMPRDYYTKTLLGSQVNTLLQGLGSVAQNTLS